MIPSRRLWVALTALLLALTALVYVLTRGQATSSAAPPLLEGSSFPLPPVSATGKPHQAEEVDIRLHEIFNAMYGGDASYALSLAEKLAHDKPNFQLAQLVYADLLRAQIEPLHSIGEVAEGTLKKTSKAQSSPLPGSTPEVLSGQDVLSRLLNEYSLRQSAWMQRPPENTLPAQVLQLPPSIAHLIAIDISRSRLYLISRNAQGLHLARDFYISVGRQGSDKKREGDEKTPLGVYFLTGRMDEKSLLDFYGSGALPLNYPNPMDRLEGRTGGGIWLHGTPASQYARFPRSSNGCIVLSNPNMQELMLRIQQPETPVLIANHLDWVTAPDLHLRQDFYRKGLGPWFETWLKRQPAKVQQYYRTIYQPDHHTSESSPIQAVAAEIFLDHTLLSWENGTTQTMVTRFTLHPSGHGAAIRKTQYWQRHSSGVWKLAHESP